MPDTICNTCCRRTVARPGARSGDGANSGHAGGARKRGRAGHCRRRRGGRVPLPPPPRPGAGAGRERFLSRGLRRVAPAPCARMAQGRFATSVSCMDGRIHVVHIGRYRDGVASVCYRPVKSGFFHGDGSGRTTVTVNVTMSTSSRSRGWTRQLPATTAISAP